MLYYPQLASGTVCQFPIAVRTNMRTISNELLDGSVIRMSDFGARSIRWQLIYSELSDNEWQSIEELFQGTEGRLITFTFLDPVHNLLTWSEDWTKQVWDADPLLQVTQELQDPLGGSNAVELTNTSQAAQGIKQTIASASWFRYCYSVYLRSNSPSLVDLVAATSGQESLVSVAVGPHWRRATWSTVLSSRQDAVSFGIRLPAGARIQAFGAQVEAQGAASSYKKTVDRSGVYPKTRFDSDALQVTTRASNRHEAVVTLTSNLA